MGHEPGAPLADAESAAHLVGADAVLAVDHEPQAGSHFSKGMGLSSKMVPTLAENCFLQARHFHRRRVDRKDSSLASQRGQVTPCGQRSLTMKARQLSGSAAGFPSQLDGRPAKSR